MFHMALLLLDLTIAVGYFACAVYYLHAGFHWWALGLCVAVGVFAAMAIARCSHMLRVARIARRLRRELQANLRN